MSEYTMPTVGEAAASLEKIPPEASFSAPYLFELHCVDGGFSIQRDEHGHAHAGWLATTLQRLCEHGFQDRLLLFEGAPALICEQAGKVSFRKLA